MQCLTCQFENHVSSRFCSSCGNKLVTDDNIKAPSEVNVKWLIDVIKSLGYEVKQDDSDTNDDSFVAYHTKKSNLFIQLKNNISLMGVTALWNIKKPGLVMRHKYLSLINKANEQTWFCSYSLNNKMDGLHVTGYMFLTEKLSNRDIASFLEKFNESMHNGFDSSGLIDIA